MESTPGSGPSPAEFAAPTGEPVAFEAPKKVPEGLPIVVNMGHKGKEPTAAHDVVESETPFDSTTPLFATTEAVSTEQPKFMTELERAQNRLADHGVYLSDGSVHPDVVAALVAEGHNLEEIGRMSATTLDYVLKHAVDEDLWNKHFAEPIVK